MHATSKSVLWGVLPARLHITQSIFVPFYMPPYPDSATSHELRVSIEVQLVFECKEYF